MALDVLIIEDDADIRDVFREALELEGYDVETARNGKDGLELLRRGPKPKLVLLDMMMPIMGGRECLNEILKDSTIAPIPVFIVSAVADSINSLGAVGFIKKPVNFEVLLQMVEQYCGLPKKEIS